MVRNEDRTRCITFLGEFEEGGCFEEFTKLVKNDDDLELLFRGNSSDNGEAIIYYRNNVMFKLSVSSRNAKVTINYNHLRYTPGWQDVISKEYMNYSFPLKTEDDIKPKKSYSIGYVNAIVGLKDAKETFTKEYVTGLYSISKRVMEEDYFSTAKNRKNDQFRKSLGAKPSGREKSNHLEKENQQAYFSATSRLKSGLFIYDLEYKEPFANKNAKSKAMKAKKRQKMNKPDCMGIRFDSKGNPISFVLVEIKSKKEAEEGTSGTTAHLDGMMDDLKDDQFVQSRILEADKIIQDYKTLELKGLTKVTKIPDIRGRVDEMNREILIVYTDEAAEDKAPGIKQVESKKHGTIKYSVEIFKKK